MTEQFRIDPEFQALCPPLSDDEFEQLEVNILSEGCRDALVVWHEEGLLLDGHNRYNICSKYNQPHNVKRLSLPDRAAAINWIVNNQLGRRNVTPQQASYLRGKLYNAEKADPFARPGNDNRSELRGDHFDPREKTADRLATQLGVSPATVKRDAKFADSVDRFEPDTRRDILAGQSGYTKQDIIQAQGDAEKLSKPHVAHNSGNNEWYTPAEYIKAARRVMGRIDLDPASSATANEVVKAAKFYTAEDDGLAQEWGGNVWMNPPYSSDLIGKFAAKLVDELEAGRVREATVLVNNATETQWFQLMADEAACLCFPRGRVRFWKPDGELGAPLQGQAIIYLGQNHLDFMREFSAFGLVLRAV